MCGFLPCLQAFLELISLVCMWEVPFWFTFSAPWAPKGWVLSSFLLPCPDCCGQLKAENLSDLTLFLASTRQACTSLWWLGLLWWAWACCSSWCSISTPAAPLTSPPSALTRLPGFAAPAAWCGRSNLTGCKTHRLFSLLNLTNLIPFLRIMFGYVTYKSNPVS